MGHLSIDDYLTTLPEGVRERLQTVREVIARVAPAAVETISYQMPTFDLNGRHLVHFAGYKNHIGLYPLPTGDDDFQQRAAPYKTAKATVRFPHNKPIPLDLLRDIIELLMAEESPPGIRG